MYSYVNNEVLVPVLESDKFEEDSNSEEITFHNLIVLLLMSLIIFGSFASVFLIYRKIKFVCK
jgi:hypothetical protein